MSKLARALVIGATLAAMYLVGMTTAAHAYPLDPANDQPTSTQDAQRPPTERQVGESWRHGSVASPHTGSVDAKHRALVERSHTARHAQVASQEQTAADAALQRVQARERFSISNATPVQTSAPVPAKPSRQPGWLIVSLVVLVAALALAGGLAVLAAKRTRRRVRLEHAA
jgi:hypothetical protein